MRLTLQALILKILCAWGALLLPCLSSAQADIFWTPEARASYRLISELRIKEAMEIIRLQAITHPQNRIWPYLQDYGFFLQNVVRYDHKKADDFLAASQERLRLVSAVSESNPMSLMCQGQINLHQAILRIQANQYPAAATYLNRAFKMLRKNQKAFPDDYGNLRLFAALKIAFGAIPDDYRWLVSVVTSLRGSIDEGLGELHTILQNSDSVNNIFFRETVLLTALAEGRINNNPAAAINLISRHLGKTPRDKAMQYILANLYTAEGNTEAAIRTLTGMTSAPLAERIPYMDMMLGKCKLNRGDDDADIYFKNFLLFNKGSDFIKEAHQKLAWFYLLKGDRSAYFEQMQLVTERGNDKTDADIQAKKEAESLQVPHPSLLKARLLFDGGYYEKAGAVLQADLYKALTHRAHRLEYMYRKGRVLHAQKSYAEALHYYHLTIRSGEHEPYYFACSAALHCGNIHESLGSEGAAEEYYLICLQIRPESYATTLHQQARTGLNRMGR